MQHYEAYKRTQSLLAIRVAIVIGTFLVLVLASYMAYEAIDAEALRASLLR
jgi:hypothetical protein